MAVIQFNRMRRRLKPIKFIVRGPGKCAVVRWCWSVDEMRRTWEEMRAA